MVSKPIRKVKLNNSQKSHGINGDEYAHDVYNSGN